MGLLAALYGGIVYAIFLATFVYAIGFVGNLLVPKSVDLGLPPGASGEPLLLSLLIDVLLLGIFAIQHSVMARPQFKQWWLQFVPKSVERSTYVLLASLALILLFWQWRAMPDVVWQVANPAAANAVVALSFAGWLIVLASTFMINHFELFCLHQVFNNLAGQSMPTMHFKTPMLYNFVRHSIYLGFIIAFWAAPTMTVGHLLFAAVTTAYIFVGIFLEEHDLVEIFGEDYRRYRQNVSMLIPWRRST